MDLKFLRETTENRDTALPASNFERPFGPPIPFGILREMSLWTTENRDTALPALNFREYGL